MKRLILSIIMVTVASAYAHAEICVQNRSLRGARDFQAALINQTNAASIRATKIHRIGISDYFCAGTDGETPLYLAIYFNPDLDDAANYDPKNIVIYVSSKSYTVQPDKHYSVTVRQGPNGAPIVTAVDSTKPKLPIIVPMKSLVIQRD